MVLKNSDEWDKLVERIEVLESIVRDKVLDPYEYGPSIGSPGPYYADGSVNPNYKVLDPDRFGPPLYMIGKYYADGSVNPNYKGSGSLNGEDRSYDVDLVKFENCFIRFSDVIDCLEANTSVHCAIEDMKLSLTDFSGKDKE